MFWLYLLPVFATQPPGGACVSQPSHDFFVWVEWPWILDVAPAEDFYNQLLAFTQKNCIGASVTRLILRVLHPNYPSAASSLWWPPASSPMYTNLIAKLPSNVELVLYPYIKDSDSGANWMSFGNASNPIEGAWAFMSQWNKFLEISSTKFVGTVIDLEEVSGMQSYANVAVDASLATALKAKFGQHEFGVAAGFDGVGKIQSGFDKVYVELYDFYKPKAYAAQDAVTSPFLENRGNVSAMVDYILNVALTPYQLENYFSHSNIVMAMWSDQNLNGSCLFPDDLKNICGINYEFGTWSAQGFHEFLAAVKLASPAMAAVSHGIFQFSYIPTSWTY